MIRYGEGGETTDVVCGYLTSDDPLFDPGLRALPPVFVVSPTTPAAQAFVRANIDYALHQTSLVGDDRVEVPTDVPRLLLAEILRIHLSSAPAAQSGWFRALRDPVLAPALAALHADPGRKWTVAELARTPWSRPPRSTSASATSWGCRRSGTSRPGGCTPRARCSPARELAVATVARRVGYESEEAFSRAFKRVHGISPGRWRVRHERRGLRRPQSKARRTSSQRLVPVDPQRPHPLDVLVGGQPRRLLHAAPATTLPARPRVSMTPSDSSSR